MKNYVISRASSSSKYRMINYRKIVYHHLAGSSEEGIWHFCETILFNIATNACIAILGRINSFYKKQNVFINIQLFIREEVEYMSYKPKFSFIKSNLGLYRNIHSYLLSGDSRINKMFVSYYIAMSR